MFIKHPEFVDLIQAFRYRIPEYMSEAIRLGVVFPTGIRSDLLVALLVNFFDLSVVWMFVSWKDYPACCEWHYARGLSLLKVQTLIQLVHPRCTTISPNLLFLLEKVIWHFDRGFLNPTSAIVQERLRIVYDTLISIRHLPVTQTMGCMPCDASCSSYHHMLVHWFAMGNSGSGITCAYEIDIYMDGIERFWVEALLKNDTIDHICKKGGTLLHVLMAQTTPSYMEWKRITSRLIVLAKLSANPKLVHNGRTPVQPYTRSFGIPRYVHDKRTRPILKYHERHGMWPDFEPIIKKHDLKGPALWQLDDNGHTIFEPISGTESNGCGETGFARSQECNIQTLIEPSRTTANHQSISIRSIPRETIKYQEDLALLSISQT